MTVRGVRIGLVGVLTENAAEVIKRPELRRPAGRADGTRDGCARRPALRKAGADLIVVLAHEGGECTRFDDPLDTSSCDPNSEIFRYARALPHGTVDVIVGGHKNAGVAHVVAGIPHRARAVQSPRLLARRPHVRPRDAASRR